MCRLITAHFETLPLHQHLLLSLMSLLTTAGTWWKLLNYHLLGRHTCKVFDIDISSQTNELFNLLSVSPDCCHVKGSLPSLVPLVDLVFLPRRGAAGDFLLHRGRLWGVTRCRVWTHGERKRLKWCSKGRETEKKKAHHTLRQLFFSLDWTTTVNPVLLGQTALNPCLSKHTCIWTFLGITHARLNAWCQYRVWWIHNILVTNFSSTADEHWWQRMTYMNKWRKKNSQNCQQRNGKEMTYYSTYQEEVTFSHSTGYSKTSHLL